MFPPSGKLRVSGCQHSRRKHCNGRSISPHPVKWGPSKPHAYVLGMKMLSHHTSRTNCRQADVDISECVTHFRACLCFEKSHRMYPDEQTTLVATPAQHAACEVGIDKALSVGEDITKAKTSRSNGVGISIRCTAQFPASSLNILKSGHHHISSGPAVNMALFDQVLHVKTPAEWGKPIYVDEK